MKKSISCSPPGRNAINRLGSKKIPAGCRDRRDILSSKHSKEAELEVELENLLKIHVVDPGS